MHWYPWPLATKQATCCNHSSDLRQAVGGDVKKVERCVRCPGIAPGLQSRYDQVGGCADEGGGAAKDRGIAQRDE